MTAPQWNEKDSRIYRQLSAVAVPYRADQLASLLTLIPFARDDAFRVVELASGEGFLSASILEAFPQATVLALDSELSMRQATVQRNAGYGKRCSVADFNLLADDWYALLDGADVVISSLCIHHLNGAGKQALFAEVSHRISERGAFLIADLVAPKHILARELFAQQWDDSVAQASQAIAGNQDLYQHFLDESWNYYRFPDDYDQPSPLFDQLLWLKQAGFPAVDCYWMHAGHAIYGGHKQISKTSTNYAQNLQITRKVLANP